MSETFIKVMLSPDDWMINFFAQETVLRKLRIVFTEDDQFQQFKHINIHSHTIIVISDIFN